jgi:hypothetical protein
MNSNQHCNISEKKQKEQKEQKEQIEYIVNVIVKLKQQIILIENKLQELSIFYITNKDKYDYELAKTVFDNLQNFIENEIINIDISYLQKIFGYEKYNHLLIIKYYNKYNKVIINRYIDFSRPINNPNIINITPEQLEHYKQEANTCFNIICNEEEIRLTLLMLIIEKKLKHYENLMKLYHEKPEIENIIKLYPKKNIVIISVIFLIMLVFSVTIVLLINSNYNIDIMLKNNEEFR